MRSFKKIALASIFVLMASAYAETTTVKHLSGETKISGTPERIVAFDFGTLDTLKEFDIDVIGIPKANIPTYLSEYEADKYINFGTLKEPDFEAIHAAKPDLIVITLRQASLYDQFSEIAPTVNLNVDYEDYMGSLENNVKTLGKIFKKEDLAEKKLKNLNQQIAELRAKTDKMDEKVLLLLVNSGKISVYGPKSRFGFIHDIAGFKPADTTIKNSAHGQSVSMEYLLNLDPDYIFVFDRNAVIATGGNESAKQVIENDLVKNTKAYKNGKIIYLDPNIWYLSSGGLESTQKMIDDLNAALEQ